MHVDRFGLGRKLSLALALAAGLWSGPVAAQADLLSELSWRDPASGFGGLSGVEVSGDGRQLLALSDRGRLIEADIRRGDDGAIAGISRARIAPLVMEGGARPAAWSERDSEGLALTAGGEIWISYEGDDRVARHGRDGRLIERLAPGPGFETLQVNAALEALAADAEGTLYAVPERSGADDRPFPVYRFRDGSWDIPYSLPRRGAFLPTGLDFDDRGRIYVLEREFRPLAGFATRIRRFSPGADGPGDEEVLLRTRPGRHGNLEGLSLWRDGAGRLVATMVSDDNFNPLMASQIVEYLLPD